MKKPETLNRLGSQRFKTSAVNKCVLLFDTKTTRGRARVACASSMRSECPNVSMDFASITRELAIIVKMVCRAMISPPFL